MFAKYPRKTKISCHFMFLRRVIFSTNSVENKFYLFTQPAERFSRETQFLLVQIRVEGGKRGSTTAFRKVNSLYFNNCFFLTFLRIFSVESINKGKHYLVFLCTTYLRSSSQFSCLFYFVSFKKILFNASEFKQGCIFE